VLCSGRAASRVAKNSWNDLTCRYVQTELCRRAGRLICFNMSCNVTRRHNLSVAANIPVTANSGHRMNFTGCNVWMSRRWKRSILMRILYRDVSLVRNWQAGSFCHTSMRCLFLTILLFNRHGDKSLLQQ